MEIASFFFKQCLEICCLLHVASHWKGVGGASCLNKSQALNPSAEAAAGSAKQGTSRDLGAQHCVVLCLEKQRLRVGLITAFKAPKGNYRGNGDKLPLWL